MHQITHALPPPHDDPPGRWHGGRNEQSHSVERLREARDMARYLVDGGDLPGPDVDECTVGSNHPTDLGFMRMARGLHTRIRRSMEIAAR